MLTGNQKTVFERRYARKDKQGNLLETVDDVFKRVTSTVAEDEEQEEEFYNILSNLKFLPNSPTFTGAGTPLGMMSACFVLPLEDDMGKIRGGIFDTLKDMALIFQTGGGVGMSLSRLRPNGSYIHTSGGKATGPVGFLKVFDKASQVIAQGGSRRGAGMAVLRYDHPDIMDFINCKETEDDITNFNLSVAVDGDFMTCVIDDLEISLINPQDGAVAETVSARDIFSEISKHILTNGEPGLLFLDTANKDNPCPSLGMYEACNPCGEQFLKPYQNCCLGTVNLAAHLDEDALDMDALRKTIHLGVRFLDNVIDTNSYPESIPELSIKAKETRRIGLGITGLADILYAAGIRYGSQEAVEFFAELMSFIRYEAMRASIEIAEEKGPFPMFEESIYANGEWEVPEAGRKKWTKLKDLIIEKGIRNATTITIAPTGTRSTVAGVEGYGCEPTFALAYTRRLVEREGDVSLKYTSPRFKEALERSGLGPEETERVLDEVAITGSCQDVEGIHQYIKNIYVTSRDISPKEHIAMQAAGQQFVDSAISKTINAPKGTTQKQVEDILIEAWKKGCKGITIYVAGSRDKVVLETQEEKKEVTAVRPRPEELVGVTVRQPTPLGTAFVTLNRNGNNEPFEVFITIGRAGSDIAAVAEGIGRLISLILRIPSEMSTTTRLKYVVEQLKGIGGGNPLGFGKNRIRSLPDGVAEVLGKQLGIIKEDASQLLDICPECGNATLISTEGCASCSSCGYKKC